MLIIIDARIPQEAKDNLSDYGEIINFSSKGITYDAISGHPDIFFCKVDNKLIVAPNTPSEYFHLLEKNRVKYIKGNKKVSNKYPETAHYNAVVNDIILIHNLDYSDPELLKACSGKEKIFVNQAYTRCSLIPVVKNSFITSDEGIYKIIKDKFSTLYVSPEKIILPGFKNGFFGGACGVLDDKLFIIGKLKYHPDGDEIMDFVNSYNLEIVELYDGPLYDGGGILFI